MARIERGLARCDTAGGICAFCAASAGGADEHVIANVQSAATHRRERLVQVG
jgi:hypothetical protein